MLLYHVPLDVMFMQARSLRNILKGCSGSTFSISLQASSSSPNIRFLAYYRLSVSLIIPIASFIIVWSLVLDFRISTSLSACLELEIEWRTIKDSLPSWMSYPMYPFVAMYSSPSRLSKSFWIWNATPIFSAKLESNLICYSGISRATPTNLTASLARTPVLCEVICKY